MRVSTILTELAFMRWFTIFSRLCPGNVDLTPVLVGLFLLDFSSLSFISLWLFHALWLKCTCLSLCNSLVVLFLFTLAMSWRLLIILAFWAFNIEIYYFHWASTHVPGFRLGWLCLNRRLRRLYRLVVQILVFGSLFSGTFYNVSGRFLGIQTVSLLLFIDIWLTFALLFLNEPLKSNCLSQNT